MKTIQPLLPALAVALVQLGGPALALSVNDPFTIPGLRLQDGEPAAQNFSRVFGARMSTSFDADIVTLSATSVTFHFQPSRFDHKQQVFTSQRDLAVAPGTDLDFVFTVSSTGLTQWSFDEPNAVYVSTPLLPSWGNVTRLGVNSAGILMGLDPISGVIRNYTPLDVFLPEIPIAEGALDFAILDWDNDGEDDYAVRTDTEISVVGSGGGKALWSTPALADSDQIIAVRGTAPDRDLLVWAGDVGPYWAMRSHHSTMLNDGILILGNEFTGGMHAADLQPAIFWHKDRSQELMVSTDVNTTWVLARGDGETYALEPNINEPNSGYYLHPPSIEDSGSTGIVTGSGDIDQDGQDEPIYARRDDGMVAFQFDRYEPDLHPISHIDVDFAPLTGSQGLKVEASMFSQLPTAATHLLIEVWRHDDASFEVDGALIAREVIERNAAIPEVILDLGSAHNTTDVYHVAIRGADIELPLLPRTDPAIAMMNVENAFFTFSALISQSAASQAAYAEWPGVVAIESVSNLSAGNDDPVLTGPGTQTGAGTRTLGGPPPIGGVSRTGTTGSSL